MMRRALVQRAASLLQQAVPQASGAGHVAAAAATAPSPPIAAAATAAASAARLADPRALALLRTFASKPNNFLFTSECVTSGHPDKLCDQISDAVLDACLARDPRARVAVETAIKNDEVWIFGELSVDDQGRQGPGRGGNGTAATSPPLPPLDFEAIARRAIAAAGYTGRCGDGGFSAETARVRVSLDVQSPDIAQGIGGAQGERFDADDLGAGDQGHVFGYATDEHPKTLMPLTHVLSARLAERLAAVREGKAGGSEAEELRQWLRPDGKTQVTLEHGHERGGGGVSGSNNSSSKSDGSSGGAVVPLRAHTVLVSTQHSADAPLDELRREVEKHVVKPVFETEAPGLLDNQTRVLVNPAGRFVVGGPVGDAGLTGRKIIVDTYGGWGAHGGGAFSGKDPTKVDRSGAYAARQAAKSVVANGLARRCLVQVAYAIGVAEPLALHVDTYGTARAGLTDDAVARLLLRELDWRPAVLRRRLDLARGGDGADGGGRYRRTASYGHFGRGGGGEGGDADDDDVFTWEEVVPLKV